MSSPHGSKDALVDAYVRHTVRNVLFSELSSRQRDGRSPARPQQRHKTTSADELPFQVGQHHARVLGYASWSDEQLNEEKKKLTRYLKTHRRDLVKQEQTPEDEHEKQPTTGTVVLAMEALALLQLFLRERAPPNDEKKESRRLLHAQLALFAVYFEKANGRGIEHETDVVHVRSAYEAMLQTQPNEYT